jgi:hypothetical protein
MTIDTTQAENLFNALYGEIKGYSISTEAREKSGIDTSRLLYGELPFSTWKEIVEHANPKKDGVVFYLGSGTGRIVMAAYLAFDFRKAIGVELLKGLHDKACEVKENFEKNFKSQIVEHVAGRELELIQGSLFDVDLKEADFIFMNHPFKDGDEFLQLEAKFLSELKPGTKIATIIRSLKNPAFKQLGSKTYKFSWGDSTAHFHEV